MVKLVVHNTDKEVNDYLVGEQHITWTCTGCKKRMYMKIKDVNESGVCKRCARKKARGPRAKEQQP